MDDTDNSKQAAVVTDEENQGPTSTIGLPVPKDYVGNFMEGYYVTEFAHQVCLHVGPVVNNQREVWVLNHNRMYAEDLNKIIIGDLSLHMTQDASTLSLNQELIAQQLVLADTLIPRSVKDYMTMKHDPQESDTESDSEDEMEQGNKNGMANREPATKRKRDDNSYITASNSATNVATVSTLASDETYIKKIELLEQQLKSHSETIEKLSNASTTTINTNFEERFSALETIITNQSTTVNTQIQANATELAVLLEKVDINEIKTKTRIDTVYDTIATSSTELNTNIQIVREEMEEANIEIRADNKIHTEKLDKILSYIADKEKKTLKSIWTYYLLSIS